MPSLDAVQRFASLEGYLKEDPANASLLAETVMTALECGAVERACELLERSPLHGCNDPQVQQARAFAALAAHRFDEAAAILHEMILRGAAAPAVRFNLAYAQFRGGDIGRALAAFDELLHVDGAPLETLAYIVRCHHHLGNPGTATQAWEAAADRFKTPHNGGIASLAYLDSNRLDDALRLAERALLQADPPIEAMVTRATLLLGDGDVQRASRLLDSAMAASPSDGRVWSAVGATRLLSGDVVHAEEAFRRASELLARHVGTWLSLGWCQILRKDLGQAQQSFEIALAIDRTFAETHGGLAVVAALQGRVDDARMAIERAQRLDRGGLSARYAEAILSGNASDGQAIEALARRLLHGKPGPDGVALLERAMRGARRTGR